MQQVAGIGSLIRLIIRRDRMKLAIWLMGIIGLIAIMMPTLQKAYGSEADRAAIAAMMNESAATKAMGFMDDSSMGSLLMVEIYLFAAVLVAFMSTTLVVRHTRQNEENGSAEVMQSAPVGRYAPMGAALAVALGANVIIAVATGLVLSPYAELHTESVWGLGLALGLVGVVSALIGAIAAQLSSTARGANGLASAAIGVLFLVRSVGDVLGSHNGTLFESAWPSWLSPLGWGQQMHLFTNNVQWWAVGLFVVLSALLAGAAFVLLRTRDLGEGMVSLRSGAARASTFLATPLGLAWKLQRSLLGWWMVVMVLCGLLYGALTESFGELLNSSIDTLQQYMTMFSSEADMVNSYLGSMLLLNVMFIVAYAVQAALRFRQEEAAGRMEILLAAPIDRVRWFVTHMGIVLVGVALLLVGFGAALGASYVLVADVAVSEIIRLAAAALVYWPALAVVVGVVAVAVALVPRLSGSIGWALFLWIVLVAQFGLLLQFPEWLRKLTPLEYISAVPVESPEVAPLVVMSLLGGLLTVIGCSIFRQRDTGQ